MFWKNSYQQDLMYSLKIENSYMLWFARDKRANQVALLTQIWIVKTEQQEHCQTVHSLLAGI